MTVKTILIRCAVEVGIALVTEEVVSRYRKIRSHDGGEKPKRKLGFKKSYYELEEEGL